MLGHQAGDRLLVSVGKRLRRSIKSGDTLARLGGDEFTVLQTGVRRKADSEALARRIVKTLNEPFMIGDAQVSEKHTNFLINTGDATSEDIETLGEEVKRRVYKNSGVELEWEIRRVGRP